MFRLLELASNVVNLMDYLTLMIGNSDANSSN